MNLGLIFFQFLPLILFAIATHYKGLKAGVFGAVLGVLILFAYDHITTGKVDTLTIVEGGLILFLGGVSVALNNEKYFKFQPTIVAVLIVIVFVYYEIKGTPFFISYIPHMERYFQVENPSEFSKQALANLHSDVYRILAEKLSRVVPFVIALHGALMAYAALRLKLSHWLLLRLTIYPALLAAVVIVGIMNVKV